MEPGRRFKLDMVTNNVGYRRIIGTFPSGEETLLAVPLKKEGKTPWIAWLSRKEAEEWIEYLNRLDLEGKINWESSYPFLKDEE